MYQRILVATDGTALSRKAVTAAIDMARLCSAQLVVLNVLERYQTSLYEGIAVSSQNVAGIEEKRRDVAQAIVDAAKDAAARQGVQAKGVLVYSGVVAEAVIAAATKHKADLVVMASHGRRGIKRVLLGSETQHVLTHSTVPVLVLR